VKPTLFEFLGADSFDACQPGNIEKYFIAHHLDQAQGNFYFEAGAVNGFHMSQTATLEHQHNWQGILVEAHADFHSLLAEGRSENACVHACLGNGQPAWFEQKGQGLMGHSQIRGKRINEECIPVETLTINQVLEEYQAPRVIDYMVLDVEHAFLEVWQGLDLDRWQVNFMGIEMKGTPSMEIIRAMDANGLELVQVLGNEDFIFSRT
jgi:hypothetical protein